MLTVPEQPIVSLREVHKNYRLGTLETPVLRGVTADLRPGRITVLSGASGSGKTTLLNLIGGLDQPGHGQVLVEGRDLGTMADDALSDLRRARIGFVFQNFNLLPMLTALENVEYPLRLKRVPAAQGRERALRALEEVGLEGAAHQRPDQLSGGQRQRVAIARALVKDPLLVLADEPTANLDTGTSVNLLHLLRDVQRRHGAAFVISSHDPMVLNAADDALVLKDGRIVDPVDSSVTCIATS